MSLLSKLGEYIFYLLTGTMSFYNFIGWIIQQLGVPGLWVLGLCALPSAVLSASLLEDSPN